jgi:ADP-heptose:LPS heptosyltransferase
VGDQLVVLHPGTAGPAKLWRAERWAAVAEALMGPGTRLLLTGGPGEEGQVEEVATRMRIRPPTLAGQTTIGQLAALLRRASPTLGVDSGPLHLAAAQGVPTVHLYGPGDAGRFGPWGAQRGISSCASIAGAARAGCLAPARAAWRALSAWNRSIQP